MLRKTEKIHSTNNQRRIKHVQSQVDKNSKDKVSVEKIIKEANEKRKKGIEKCESSFNGEMQEYLDSISVHLEKGKVELETALKVSLLLSFRYQQTCNCYIFSRLFHYFLVAEK